MWIVMFPVTDVLQLGRISVQHAQMVMGIHQEHALLVGPSNLAQVISPITVMQSATDAQQPEQLPAHYVQLDMV